MLTALAALFEFAEKGMTLWNWATSAARYIKHGSFPGTERAHRQEVREQLNTMPFIYSDLEGTLESDFVNMAYRFREALMIEISQEPYPYNWLPDVEAMETRNREAARDRDQANAHLHQTHRALFLGNAGIGKTTFLSRITLSLTDKEDTEIRRTFFAKELSVVPVFVPLKVLENSDPHPIFSYIFTHYRFFNGPKGMRVFQKLAAERRLLIVLDGYDEVYTSGGAENRVIRDIEALFDARPDNLLHSRSNEDMIQLYHLMRRNDVWLSSRRDYYLANRLQCEKRESWRLFGDPAITCIDLFGVTSRIDLVRKIFDKHRAASQEAKDLLSEDAFFAYVDRTFDEEMVRLSYNPLFLTMMCYVYVKHLDSNGNVAHGELGTVRKIILQCVQLLLTDLDKYKVSKLQPRVKRSLEEKRGLYPAQKRAFLGYFAAQVEADTQRGRRAFTKSEIVEEARRYFLRHANRRAAQDILRGLDRDNASSIVNQLIKQELFVRMSARDATLYDFPHRRFREVLASTYLDTPKRIRRILENVHNPDQRELFLVLFAVTEKQADWLLEAILHRAEQPQSERYFVTLAAACIQARGSGYDPSAILQTWLKHVISSNRLQTVPTALLPHVSVSEAFCSWLTTELTHALNTGDAGRTAMAGAILQFLRPDVLPALVVELLPGNDSSKTYRLLHVLLSAAEDAFIQLLERYIQHPQYAFRLAASALLKEGVTGSEPWWRRMCAVLPLPLIAHLMRVAEKSAPHLTLKLLGFEGRPELLPELWSELGDNGPVYLLAHAHLDDLSVERGRRVLRKVPENVYFSFPAIPPLDRPDEEEAILKLWKGRVPPVEQDPELVQHQQRMIAEAIADIHEDETNQTYDFVRTRLARPREEWSAFVRLRQMPSS